MAGVVRPSSRLVEALLLAAAVFSASTWAQSPAQPPATSKVTTSAKSAPPMHYLPNRFAGRAGAYYRLVWGIDSLTVRWAESGEVIRFSWRVLDPAKASALNEKNATPSLIDPQAGVGLVVPTLEKIGQLRQSAPPEAGKSYWMAFSNKGRLVARGHRVNVVVGPFHAEGLMVD